MRARKWLRENNRGLPLAAAEAQQATAQQDVRGLIPEDAAQLDYRKLAKFALSGGTQRGIKPELVNEMLTRPVDESHLLDRK